MGNSSDGQSSVLRLHVVQADYGDCLILEYGQSAAPRFMLIDGGPPEVYSAHLKPALKGLAQRGAALEAVMLTHVDEDHVVGLVDLAYDLVEAKEQNSAPLISVHALWYNTFRQALGLPDFAYSQFQDFLAAPAPDGGVNPVAFSIAQGELLLEAARALEMPVNPGFADGVIQLRSAPQVMQMDGARLWVLGPRPQHLEKLKKDWLIWYEKRKKKPSFGSGAQRAARAIDRAVANRSSIILLAEGGGRRILLTGDAHGDDILFALEQAGLLDANGCLHVDVLKVQHHGSLRNASPEFFQKLTADVYVISANKHGHDGNPDLETLNWILDAPRPNGRIRMVATNLTPNLKIIKRRIKKEKIPCELVVLAAGEHSIRL